MQYEVYVVADTNDGDYISKITVIDESDISMLLKAVEIIKERGCKRTGQRVRYAWPDSEYSRDTLHTFYGLEEPDETLSEEDEEYKGDRDLIPEIRWFRQFVPCGEYGVHTLIEITYYPLPEKIRLL